MFVKFDDVAKLLQKRLENLKSPSNNKPIRLFQAVNHSSYPCLITEDELGPGKVIQGKTYNAEDISKKIAARAEVEEKTANPIRGQLKLFFSELRHHLDSVIDKLEKEALDSFCPMKGYSNDFLEDFDSGMLNNDQEILNRITDVLQDLDLRTFSKPKKMEEHEKVILAEHVKKLDKSMKNLVFGFYTDFKESLFASLRSDDSEGSSSTELYKFKPSKTKFSSPNCVSFNPYKYDEFAWIDEFGKGGINVNGSRNTYSFEESGRKSTNNTVKFNREGSLLLISKFNSCSIYSSCLKEIICSRTSNEEIIGLSWISEFEFMMLSGTRLSKCSAEKSKETRILEIIDENLVQINNKAVMTADDWDVYFGASDGELLIYEYLRGFRLKLRLVKYHTEKILSLSVNPEQTHLVSTGEDLTMILMHLKKHDMVWKIKVGFSISQAIWTVGSLDIFALAPVMGSILKISSGLGAIIEKTPIEVSEGMMVGMSMNYFEGIVIIADSNGEIRFNTIIP